MGNRPNKQINREPDLKVLSIKTTTYDNSDNLKKRITQFENGSLLEDNYPDRIELKFPDITFSSDCHDCNERLGIMREDPVRIAEQLIIEEGDHLIQDKEIEFTSQSRTIKHNNIIIIEDCLTGSIMKKKGNSIDTIFKERLDQMNLVACKSDPSMLFNRINDYY